MRTGVAAVLVIVLLGVGLTALAAALRRKRSPDAIVLVTIDTLRADRVGAYGNTDGLTPNLDALAADGVVFEKAWTTAPLTVPAHASALTGLLPPLHGLRTNAPDHRLPAAAARPYSTVAEILRSDGFATGAFVSASVLRAERTGLDAGFDVYDDVPAAAPGALHDEERSAEATVRAAAAWVRGVSGRCFLWVHLFDPHAPYDAPSPWGAGAAHAADAGGYDGEVRYADHAVGLLREALADAGLEHVVFVVAADHGEALGAHGEPTHGYLLHEETLHIPLIVSAPGLVADGGRRQDPVSLADVAPTLVSLAGVNIPPTMDGRPLFAGGAMREPRAPYAETLYGYESARWAQMFAVRRGDRKVVDVGPRVLDIDLATPGAEDAPAAHPVGDLAADSELATTLAGLRRVAGLPAMAAPSHGADELAGGSYWSPATSRAPGILAAEANAALASPYDRMDVLRDLDRGRAALAAAAPFEAVLAFEEALAADPDNPQARRWMGRAQLAAGQNAAAAASYRAAFDAGWEHPDCVAKALQAAVLASAGGDTSEARAGLDFLATARGRGVTQTGPAFICEAHLHLVLGQNAEAGRAVESARAEPRTPWLEGALRQIEPLLR